MKEGDRLEDLLVMGWKY